MRALAKNAVRTDSNLALQGNLSDLAHLYNTLFNKQLIYQNPYQILSVKSASTRQKNLVQRHSYSDVKSRSSSSSLRLTQLPSNRLDIYFKELGSESPILVKLIMQSIYQSDKRRIKHIGAQQFGMKFLLRGLYAHNGLFYFYTSIDNDTNMPFAVDFVTFKVVDKKVAKRTAMQEQVLQPLRAYHQLLEVKANDNERGVFVLEQFSLSQDKELQVTLYERGGGRTLSFSLDQEDLLLAQKIDKLKLKW